MLQGGEIIIILILALIVLGPRRLPDLALKLGKWTRELRTAAREINQGLRSEMKDLADMGRELKAPLDELQKPLKDLRRELSDSGRYEWKGPKPVTGPTPEDALADLEEMESSSDEDEAGA